MHSKANPPAQRTCRSRVERSIKSLLGLIEGIVADRVLNRMEFNFLEQWLSDHADFRDRHPYNELIPCVAAVVDAGKLSEDEKTNLTWMCEQLLPSTPRLPEEQFPVESTG